MVTVYDSQPIRSIAATVTAHATVDSLLRSAAPTLAKLGGADFVYVSRPTPEGSMTCEPLVHECAASVPPFPAEDAPSAWSFERKEPLVLPDLATESRFGRATTLLREHGYASLWTVPLATTTRSLGALGFARRSPGAPAPATLDALSEVANLLAVGLENALNRESLAAERDTLARLLEVSNAAARHLELPKLLEVIASILGRTFPNDYTSLCVVENGDRLRVQALRLADSRGHLKEGESFALSDGPLSHVIATRQPFVIHTLADALPWLDSDVGQKLMAEGLASGCSVPLVAHDRVIGLLNVGSRSEGAITPATVELLARIATQLAPAVENALSYRELRELKNKLAAEKLYLEAELRADKNFEEIRGESPKLTRVLSEVKTVAPTDATVLITGETGTGKELVARAVHALSARKDRTFIKLNCAAIPSGLVESELFGHERGAFTGAIAAKAGRFELADEGTLFLDEIAEIPLELQAKLLRVLQEKQFERLGSSKTVKVDVRVVAATNRDLEKAVAEGRFRSDLYYRLNVFPIELPPLRERPEDVPVLVRHFVSKFARRAGKSIESIPQVTLEKLTRYPWPGNVRELENLIERSVIISTGPSLEVPLVEAPAPIERPETPTLVEAERQLILRVLGETKWVIGGKDGAAERLGMNRTTLNSRMRKHGIVRPS